MSTVVRKKRKEMKGKGRRRCVICGRPEGLVRRYHIYLCRQCFREKAEAMGFSKY